MSKNKVYKLIFSYKTIGAIFVIAQIVFFVAGTMWLQEYYQYLHGVLTLAAFLLIVHELNREVNNSFKISWLILIMLFPIAGMLLYLLMHSNMPTKHIKTKLDETTNKTKNYLKQDKSISNEINSDESKLAGLSNYLYKTVGFPTHKCENIKYFSCGEEYYEELIHQLSNAKKFIFLEYFIIAEGFFWNNVLDILKDKASNGVKVKILFDGMGCLAQFNRKYPHHLKKFGIECRIFAPVMPFISSYQNNRDHRKIAVIDGNFAFTGGINLADEYINQIKRYGHWKDNGIMIKGRAVNSFTAMFLQIWDIAPEKEENYDEYFQHATATTGDGYIIPYSDTPLDNEPVGRNVYLEIINTAEKYVHIMTPYLVPDSETLEALKFAAKRGVDVKIMMPGIPDKWYAFVLAKTFYPELISAGVKIYEYAPGFLHSKTMISDNQKAVVGTINQDYRSMYLHYECAVYLYKIPQIKEIEKDFEETLKKCNKMFIEDYKKLPLISRAIGRLLRILASIM